MKSLLFIRSARVGEGGPVPLATALGNLEEGAVVQEEEVLNLLGKVAELENELQTRRLVERAKAYLSRSLGLREEEAYRLLQKNSMDTRVPLRELAEKIVVVSELQVAAKDDKENQATRRKPKRH